MKEVFKKLIAIGKLIFGYAIMICLFVGGATFFAFIIALFIGGEGAVQICAFIKKFIIPAITYTSTISVLFGILLMYLSGESALSAKKKARSISAQTKEK